MLGSCTSLLVLAGFTLRLGLVTARDLDLVDLSAVPEADNILSIHTAQANSLPIFFGATQGAPSTVSEADVSFSVHSACVCFCRAVFECWHADWTFYSSCSWCTYQRTYLAFFCDACRWPLLRCPYACPEASVYHDWHAFSLDCSISRLFWSSLHYKSLLSLQDLDFCHFFFVGVSKLWLAGKLLMYLIVLCKLLLVPLFTWSLGMLWGFKLLLICHLLWQYPALQCLWRPTETGIFCLLITATREGTFCTNVGRNWNMKDDCWNFNLIWCERVQQLGLGC